MKNKEIIIEDPIERINHPNYCVWCDRVFVDHETFKIHYRKCLSEPTPYDNLNKEQIFDLVHGASIGNDFDS